MYYIKYIRPSGSILFQTIATLKQFMFTLKHTDPAIKGSDRFTAGYSAALGEVAP
jgi:hypothetical protein